MAQSMGYYASTAYMDALQMQGPGMNPRYQYTKHSDEATKKAWNLLSEYMMPSQWTAFMADKAIELENKAGTHRLLLDKNGAFTVLKGPLEQLEERDGQLITLVPPVGDG